MMQTKALIAIQARSTSSRLPRKVFELIDGRPMLDHVIDACKKSADYVNYTTHQTGLAVHHVLVVPDGDPIVKAWGRKITVVEGPENDVLARYVQAANQFDANYIVRVTSDCPLIPPYLISKLIKLAVVHGYDYVSNVDPRFRTALDGADCEVISAALLRWLDENAEEGPQREHVTPLCREAPPAWARVGVVIGFFDQSGIKLSVDTSDELEAVRSQFKAVREKIRAAEKTYGRERVHRF